MSLSLIASYGFSQLSVTESFGFTGAVQTWVVPPGVTSIDVDAQGAQGGNGGPTTPGGNGIGGAGGRVQATLDVTPGETLYIYIGGQGQSAVLNTPTGGFNGGGGTQATSDDGRRPGAGGGATDIRIGGTALANRVLVAGGGGGSGGWQTTAGGAGGGLVGQDGQTIWVAGFQGLGGSQVAGGAGGGSAQDGSLGQGGRGLGGSHGGGGGGGGYYGGGGGRVDAGGGGSSYTDGAIATNVIHTQGFQTGNGDLSITYNQCVLPTPSSPFVTTVNDRQHTLTNVNVNGSGDNAVFVNPGQNVTLSFTYNIVAGGGASCPGCVTQMYVGIKDEWGSCVTSYGGFCNCTNNYSTSLTAPTTPGVYYFTLGASWLFGCGAPNPYLPVPNGSNEFAAIVVRDEWTTAVTNESCVGDNDGQIAVNSVFGTAGQSFIWNTGQTTSTITSLGAGTYTVTASDSYGCYTIDTVTVATDTTPPQVFAESSLSLSLDGSGNASVTNGAIDSASSDDCPLTLEIGQFSLNGLENDYRFLGNYNGHAYFLSKNISTFAAAQANATTMGGYLATVNDAAENAALQDWVQGSFPFIGLNDIALEGTFVWDNGEPTGFFNWSGSEPNNTAGNEDCVQLYYTTGLWNDIPCNNQYLSIIEFNTPVPFANSLSFTCADTGDQVVVLRGTDQGGLTAYDTTVVTISDNSPPAIATQNITIYLDSTGLASIATDTVVTGGFDNCQLDTTFLSQYDFSCATIGANTVTVTASDVSGNQSTVNVTVTVLDTLSPIVITNDLDVYLDATGNASITPAQINNGSWDSCGIDLITLDITSFTCADTGANTVTLSVQDANGNIGTNTATVNVFDTITPTVIAQDDTVYLDINGEYTLTPAFIDAGSFDNCPLTLTIDTANFSCANVGAPLTVTLTGTDPSGNSASATATVTVLDTISPTVLTQTITIHLDALGNASIVAGDVNNGTWDSCGIASLSINPASFTCANTGPNNVTLTATDVNGNSSSGIAVVNVLDTFAPTAIGQNLTLYLDASGNASTSAAEVDNGSADTCGIANRFLNDSTFTCADVGAPVPVVLTITDVNGNTDTAQVEITILDTVSPTVIVNNSFVYVDSNGSVTISPAFVDGGTFDNCAIASLTLDTTDFNCSGHGDTIVTTFTALDVNGNSSSASVELYILDTIAPEVITQNLTVYLDSFGATSITPAMVDNGSWDSCGVDQLTLDIEDFNCANVGVNVVTLTVTDIHGNTNSATANVQVFDTIAPAISLNNLVVQLDSFGQTSITPAAANNGVWDSCGVASLVLDSSNFSCANVGIPLMVGFTATDVNGNVSVDSFMVEVEDNIAPTILAQNITVWLDSNGNTTINPGMVNTGTWDSCGIDSLWLETTSFSCADSGINNVYFYARDIHNNLDSSLLEITVLDTQPSVVITQDLTLFLNASGSITTSASAVDNGSSDNCVIAARWLSDSTFTCADTAASQVITMYVQDVSGNLDSATANMTIIDNLAPVMQTQNISAFLDSTGLASIGTIDVNNGTSDNCSIDTLWLDQYDFDCSEAATTVLVTLSARDISGNTNSQTVQVSVFDNIAPQPLVQNLTIYLDSNGTAEILPDTFDIGTWDSCGIASLSISDSSFDCNDIGVNTLTFFAEDIHGNISSIDVDLTVEDTIAPTILIQDLFVYLDSSGLASVTADSIDIGTWDSCGIASIAIDTSNFSCANHGDTLNVIFTATDIHNNVSTDTSVFIILDTLAPVLFVHNDTFFLDSAGQFVVTPMMLDDSTMDNCLVDSLFLSDTLFTCGVVDSTFDINFYAQDIHQNIDSTLVSVSFLDTIHPIITCNDSIIVPNDSGECGAVVGFNFPTAWDNCTVDSIIQIDATGLDSGSFFPVGFTELSYVAYDQSGNTDSCSFIIEVQDVEVPVLFCAPDTQICDTTYIFDLPEYTDNCPGFAVVQIAGIPSGEFYPPDTVIVNTFVVTDSYGNSDTCSTQVLRFDFPTEADAGEDQEQCEVFSTTFEGNIPAVGTGIWSLVEGRGDIADSLNPTSSVSNMKPGENTFEYRIENGVCPIERDTMTVIEYLNPNFINAGEDQILCDTTLAMLSPVVDTIGTGSWLIPTNGASIADTTLENAMISDLELGSYTFTWQVVSGVCEVLFDEIQIDVVPYPVISIADDSSHIFLTSPATLKASSTLPVTYTWSPAFTLTNVADSIVVADPEETTAYQVRGVTEFGCAGRDSVTVFVNESLEIPTAFTPDSDGWNDVWNIKELENYPNCTVKIYNRWGHLIFESAGYETPWDGSFGGSPLPSGSYFYVIELGPGSLAPLTGSVTIIKG
jgi:gliding motility-associated-like protein